MRRRIRRGGLDAAPRWSFSSRPGSRGRSERPLRLLHLRVQLFDPPEHVRLLVTEVVQVCMHGRLKEAVLLLVEQQLVGASARLLLPAGDDELRVPDRPVLVPPAELALVRGVGALGDAEQGAQPVFRQHRALPSFTGTAPTALIPLSPIYIRKTPKVDSGTGAFSAAEIPSARTRRVSRGSMIPSSQRRAVE